MGVGVTSIQNLDRRVNIPCSLSLIPHPLSPFFFIFLRTLLHFFARQKLKSFLFVAFRTLDQKKKHGGRSVATLARSRFGEWVKAPFSAALAKSALWGDPSRIGTPPMQLGRSREDSRSISQSRIET